MKVATVTGTVVSTISHEFFDAKRLLICDVEGSSGYLIAVDVVDELLERAVHPRVVVTSREPLQLADEYQGRVKVAKLNVDFNQNTAVRYRIQAIPTLLVLGALATRNRVVTLTAPWMTT